MISSSPEVSSTAQLAQVRTETLYGVKRRMNLRLAPAKLYRTTHKEVIDIYSKFITLLIVFNMLNILIIHVCFKIIKLP